MMSAGVDERGTFQALAKELDDEFADGKYIPPTTVLTFDSECML